jgi:hypothetical protein
MQHATKMKHPGHHVPNSNQQLKTWEKTHKGFKKGDGTKYGDKCKKGPACFVAGTLVAMGDGTFLPIEKVQSGMEVLQKAPQPHVQTSCVKAKVLDVQKSLSRDLAVVSTVHGKRILTTLTHPFYLPQKNQWGSVNGAMEPGSSLTGTLLDIGDKLLTPDLPKECDDGRVDIDTISEIQTWSEAHPVEVFNLTVEGHHCYFAGGVLVHNMCKRMQYAVTALAGAAAGLAIGYMTEDFLVDHGLDDELTIVMTAQAASAGGGAAAGALVGTFLCPALGTAVGAGVGAFGGFLSNGIRMMFYRATDDHGRFITEDGKPLYAGYLGAIKCYEPDPFWGPVNDPARLSATVLMTTTRVATAATIRAAERGVERAAERATERVVERAGERATERGIERAAERGIERGAERGLERGLERAAERTAERGIERAAERGIERGAERGLERGLERAAERTAERAAERTVASGVLKTATSPWLLIADGVDITVGAAMTASGADDKTTEVVAGGSSLAASVGIGAAVGSAAGGIGAIPGAAVGAGSWAVGKGVDALTQVSKGQAGYAQVKNCGADPIRVYAYDRRDNLQWKSYQNIKLNEGEECKVGATNGAMAFGNECSDFYIKVQNLHTRDNYPVESTWGWKVRAGQRYTFCNGKLCYH